MLKIHLIPPTLESVALNAISFELWKQPDIVSEMEHLFTSYLGSCDPGAEAKKWFKIRDRVVEKMSHLSLPELMKEKANEAIEWIGLRVTVWLYKIIYILPPNNLSSYIHSASLNSGGGIDRKKTAAAILKAVPNLDLYDRYRFACFHCLEDDARRLWEALPVKHKNILLHVRMGNARGEDSDDIVIYWSCCISQEFHFLDRIIEGNPRRSDNINDYFLRNSIEHWNCVSFKYFWEKLSEQEKQENTIKYAFDVTKAQVIVCMDDVNELFGNLVGDSTDICHHLGSAMNEVQLDEMFKLDPLRSMHFWLSCAYWPKRFISWDYLWKHISPDDFREFLTSFVPNGIVRPSKSELLARRQRALFKELWENAPTSIKRGFFDDVAELEEILTCFIMTADVENLGLIFDDATDEERKKIIGHSFSRHCFVHLLEYYDISDPTSDQPWEEKRLTEEEVDDFIDDLQSAFNRKQVKGDLRLLLNNFNKWKTITPG